MLSREFLIKQKKCCGKGCFMCPYIPRHTKDSTKIKDKDNADILTIRKL